MAKSTTITIKTPTGDISLEVKPSGSGHTSMDVSYRNFKVLSGEGGTLETETHIDLRGKGVREIAYLYTPSLTLKAEKVDGVLGFPFFGVVSLPDWLVFPCRPRRISSS
jgi:hypothetical protein